MRLIETTAGIVALLLILCADPAKADHFDPLVQITCIPEMNYFSIRTFHVEDTNIWDEKGAPHAMTEPIHARGVYPLNVFVEKERECRLSTDTISVRTIKYYPSDLGKCYENNAEFEVLSGNTLLMRFKAFSGSCNMLDSEMEYHRIENSSINDPAWGMEIHFHTFLDAECEEKGKNICAE